MRWQGSGGHVVVSAFIGWTAWQITWPLSPTGLASVNRWSVGSLARRLPEVSVANALPR